MRSILSVLVALLATVSQAWAASYVEATVPGDRNGTVPVVALDDPANPYRGQYSSLDEWAFAHYSYFINRENVGSFDISLQSLNEDLKAHGLDGRFTIWQTIVELDPKTGNGYALPLEVYNERQAQQGYTPATLNELITRRKTETERDKQVCFWSLGIADEAALEAYNQAAFRREALSYPHIPDWMLQAGQWGDDYYFLPDGGAVVAHKESKEFSNRRAILRRYDGQGQLVKEVAAKDYMDWQREMLTDPLSAPGSSKQYLRFKDHFEASGKLSGRQSNVASTGRFKTYRDLEKGGFIAVVDYWEGKVRTEGDLGSLIIDPYPYFNPLPYDNLVLIKEAQGASTGIQAPAPAG